MIITRSLRIWRSIRRRPSYYPVVEDDGYVMIDGGIWANNPVMNALVDALACFDIARENVRILCLGTGESTFTANDPARNGGIKVWAFLRFLNAAARAQSRNAVGQAYLLVGKNNVTRIDVPESDAPIALDDAHDPSGNCLWWRAALLKALGITLKERTSLATDE